MKEASPSPHPLASMPASIATTRLILRPFELSDAPAAFGWFGDSVVMRYSPGGPDRSIEQTAARLTRYREHQAAHAFSKWIILERDTGRPIGDSGLLRLPGYGWIDLGYRFAATYWGQGLATAAATAWVRAAFGPLQLRRLMAFVNPDNPASIRVLEKLGFVAMRRDTILGMSAILFSLDSVSPRR